MNISTERIVSNSEMIKNYKACREKADTLGNIIIFKHNQPDAVLFSIAEYEKLSVFFEYLQGLKEEEIKKIIDHLPEKSDEGSRLINVSDEDITL